jgi:hypothetical protein
VEASKGSCQKRKYSEKYILTDTGRVIRINPVKRYQNLKKEEIKKQDQETRNKMATAKDDKASINVSKQKLEKFRGNNRDTLDIKTWCLQVSRLNTVQKLGNENTAIIV